MKLQNVFIRMTPELGRMRNLLEEGERNRTSLEKKVDALGEDKMNNVLAVLETVAKACGKDHARSSDCAGAGVAARTGNWA